jgi:hypothetical protein
MRPFETVWRVRRLVRRSLSQCGMEARPYDLRTVFDAQPMLAESHSRVLRGYRVFFNQA